MIAFTTSGGTEFRLGPWTIRLTEILETFPQVFCFRKSRINENGGKLNICFK